MHCNDGTDEYIRIRNVCMPRFSDICSFTLGESSRFGILFNRLCDGIVEHISETTHDTDESDCLVTEWDCFTQYTRCNGAWNCPDGRDEFNCSGESLAKFQCKNTSHFCLDIQTGNAKCLPMKQAGDGTIDCVGSFDERDFCRRKYPNEHFRRYRCKNSDQCIIETQICDCHQDCPENDDETIACHWINNGQEPICNKKGFRCRNNQFLLNEMHQSPIHCNSRFECSEGEDEIFCDLIDVDKVIRDFSVDEIESYVKVSKSGISRSLSTTNDNSMYWYCNYGLYVRSITDSAGFVCLCSDHYYGDRCQFQRKRVILSLRLQTSSIFNNSQSIFKFVVLLVRNGTKISVLSHEQFIYIVQLQCLPRYIIHLLYPIDDKSLLSVNHSVEIHMFDAQTLKHWFSWQFDVPFNFLPVNRMSKHLVLPDPTLLPKSLETTINKNSSNTCSEVALYLGHDIDRDRDICICPLNRIGSRCFIPLDQCTNKSCNGHGKCMHYDERIIRYTHKVFCICDKGWHGTYCQSATSRINILFNRNVPFPLSKIAFIHAFHLVEKNPIHYINLHHLHEDESNFTIYFNRSSDLPSLIFIQLYEDRDQFNYYLLFVSSKSINETNSEIHSSNRCRSINELFNSSVLAQPPLRRVKNYQEPCLKQQYGKKFPCFYDDKVMCLCNRYHYTDCFNFESTSRRCPSNKCNERGTCVQEVQCAYVNHVAMDQLVNLQDPVILFRSMQLSVDTFV